MMRIIAGEYKGRTIEMPNGIRPTSDKVREALFDILKSRMEGAIFLDLYCGSGAIGIEAISRGASHITFVDNNNNCISVLNKNIAKLGIQKAMYDIYNKDCLKGIKELSGAGKLFNIVFLDPPYYKDLAKNTLIELSKCDILTPYAAVVAEVFKKEALPEEIGALRKTRSYKYGDTILEVFGK